MSNFAVRLHKVVPCRISEDLGWSLRDDLELKIVKRLEEEIYTLLQNILWHDISDELKNQLKVVYES
jgi:hypothetical protein